MENELIAESTTILGQLETSLGVPTFAFLANWTGEYSVDADEKAARHLTTTMVQRLRTRGSNQAALVLGARGGYPEFADRILRMSRQLDVELEVLVPCRIDGAAGLVAAAAELTTVHPRAGIGALDVGLCVVPRRPLDAALFAHCPVEPIRFAQLDQGQQTMIARLALDRYIREQQRRMVSHVLGDRVSAEAIEGLLESRLGAGMSFGVRRLNEIGSEARVAPEPLAEQMEELIDWARGALQLFESPEERFQVSEAIETEIEFQPATRVPAAAILSVDSVWLHELDTGSPDPDAPRLHGQWRFWDPERTAEQDNEDAGQE